MSGIKKVRKYVSVLNKATKLYWHKYMTGEKIDPMYACGFSHGVEWESSHNSKQKNADMEKNKKNENF